MHTFYYTSYIHFTILVTYTLLYYLGILYYTIDTLYYTVATVGVVPVVKVLGALGQSQVGSLVLS